MLGATDSQHDDDIHSADSSCDEQVYSSPSKRIKTRQMSPARPENEAATSEVVAAIPEWTMHGITPEDSSRYDSARASVKNVVAAGHTNTHQAYKLESRSYLSRSQLFVILYSLSHDYSIRLF